MARSSMFPFKKQHSLLEIDTDYAILAASMQKKRKSPCSQMATGADVYNLQSNTAAVNEEDLQRAAFFVFKDMPFAFGNM